MLEVIKYQKKKMLKTKLGKWSCALVALMLVLFIFGISLTDTLYRSVPAGGTIMGDVAARPALALSMLAGMLAGCMAFITGVIAVIKNKERSFLVYISATIGGLLMYLLLGELVVPH